MKKNQLLLNPKISHAEQKTLMLLQEHFEKQFGLEDFIFIPSSGSSKSENDSVKLIALTQKSIDHSAARFNQYFQATSQDNWGLVLPTFHVAGFSILARANLVQASVFSSDWLPDQMQKWLYENQIAFLSLVPTQVFDLVKRQIKANQFIKKVFVGGGALSLTLRESFLQLGWPLVETYGMTETCSMIAVKDGSSHFRLMPGVEVTAKDDLLRIRCNSLAHSSIQMKKGNIEIVRFDEKSFRTEDRVKLIQENEGLYLQFLGRAGDYVKILGEGVSLLELRDKLDKVSTEMGVSPIHRFLLDLPDPRRENTIVLITDHSISTDLADRLVQRFNQVVRDYEKIHKIVKLDQIPVSELGKVKVTELKEMVLKNLSAEAK